MDQSAKPARPVSISAPYHFADFDHQARMLRAQIAGINAARVQAMGPLAPVVDLQPVLHKLTKRITQYFNIGKYDGKNRYPVKPKLQADYDFCIANNPLHKEPRHVATVSG